MTRRQKRYANTQRLRLIKRVGKLTAAYQYISGIKPPPKWRYDVMFCCYFDPRRWKLHEWKIPITIMEKDSNES